MLDRVKEYVKRVLGEEKGLSIFFSCDESSVEDYRKDPFGNPSFMLAMQKRVEATKMIELGIFEGEEGKKKEIKNHKLAPLIENVNPNLSYGDFIDYILNWSIGKDNGVLIEKVSGIPSFAPDLVVHNPDNYIQNNNIKSYENHIRR